MVREAMRSLSSLGIVEIRSGEGSFLCMNNSILSDHFKTKYLLKKYSILELAEARKALESEMVKLAATRGTEERKEYLKKMLVETILQKDLPSSFIKADFNFHMAIAECAQNSFLGEMLNTTRDLLLEINMKVVEQPGQIDKAIQSHKAILEAILSGNVQLAQEEVIAHIDMFTNVSSGIYSYHDT
jgi:GntR family transcriptional repressor for pyruvate dehydrogenase complex